jgi:hypothetical protein
MARAASQAIKVFPSGGGFRVIRAVSREKAEMLEAMGAWRREYDSSTGALLGFRVIGAEAKKMDSDLRSIETTSGIDDWEMELNVERSRTRGLSEMQRMELVKACAEPEDAIERVQAKVRVYAVIGAARGDILRVWPR